MPAGRGEEGLGGRGEGTEDTSVVTTQPQGGAGQRRECSQQYVPTVYGARSGLEILGRTLPEARDCLSRYAVPSR